MSGASHLRTEEIREMVNAVHNRPKATVVVVSEVVCRDGTIAWMAKVKLGRYIIAKCGETCAHWLPEAALEALRERTRESLGIR